MRRHTHVLSFALAATAAVAVTGATFAGESGRHAARAEATPFVKHPAVTGRRSLGKLLATAPAVQNTTVEGDDDETVSPVKPSGPGARPATKGIRDDPSAGLTKGKRLHPLLGKALPSLRGLVKQPTAGAARTTQATSHATSGTDFAFFQSTPIPTTATHRKGEPSVGNDRDTILMTGNQFAAVSTDNGLSFGYISPYLLDDANGDGTVSDGETSDGGFCCDQLVNASDEGGHELAAWLLQYRQGGTANTTRIRIVTFEGRDKLATPENTQDRCVYDFKPSDFGFSGDDYWEDYNGLQNSDEWLYATTNIWKTDHGFQGSVVWRVKLSDLTDGNCTLEHGFEYVVVGESGPDLVQHAGSTMYWATHKDDSNAKLRIYVSPDSSDEATSHDVNITDYHSADHGTCDDPGDPAGNPCHNISERVLTGWTANGQVGWLWDVPEGDGYAFPHVQGAIFKTSDLSRVSEPIIWNDSYAWVWPAVGVNNRGHLAVVLYRIGGGQYPRPRVFLVDDVESAWEGVTMHAIASSTASPGSAWGDYGGVSRYDGCSDTWQAGVWTQTGSGTTGAQEARYVWFGRERDACPDLAVASVAHLFDSAKGIVWLADTTRNIGSGTAGASTTRYYLSKDAEQSSDDLEIAETHAVGSLGASDSSALLVEGTLPTEAKARTYYVLACSDAADVVAEITNTNNCVADGATLTVKAKVAGTITARPGVTVTRPAATTTRPALTRPTFTRPAATTTRPALTRPTLTRPAPKPPKPQDG